MQKLVEFSNVVLRAALRVLAALGLWRGEAGARVNGGAVRPTLFELVKETDNLFALEVRTGCFGEVEDRIAALSRAILEDRFDCSIGTQSDVPDRVWIALLRLGLFEELRYLVLQHALPIGEEVKAFIDFCEHEYRLCQQRGEAARSKNPDGDIFTLGFIVWGQEYVNNFLQYGMRSMMSDGNLPMLRRQGQLVLSIVTDVAGEAQIRQHPIFEQMSALADVVFITLSESITAILKSGHLVRNFYVLYGMLDHCSIYFAQGARSHLFMIPVDAIVADGSLTNMANYRHEGFECCGGGNIVANTETFLPALDSLFGSHGPICIATEELASLAVSHAHHYFTSQIIARENHDFGKHPRELFWPVPGGVEIHSVFIHPLFTTASGLAKYQRRHFANIDYGMIPRMFAASGKIKIIDDPRKAYVNNYTAANRLYETNGTPFTPEDFIRSHEWSYPVQKSLFTHAQTLPCRLQEKWTRYRDVVRDVQEINLEFIEEEPSSQLPETDLTIILPTFDRPAVCRAQVQFLRRAQFRHRVIVADSSEQPDPELLRVCRGLIEYRRFDVAMPASEKVAAVARSVTTRYVAMISDSDVSLPHAIDASLAFLQDNPDHVVAEGYVLNAMLDSDTFDIQGVLWFTEGASQGTALRRLYELMRRYQPYFRAVLRTDVYLQALDAANRAEGAFFKELAFAATVAALGKAKRLPMVHTLRGEDESLTQGANGHPFFWFLSDTTSFFDCYVGYRNNLATFIKELHKREAAAEGDAPTGSAAEPANLTQILDVIHATYFGREIDTGIINHTASFLLGDPIKPIKAPVSKRHAEAIDPADLVHPAGRQGRRYVWRQEVLNAEPRSEITIDDREIARVESALDQYVLAAPGRVTIASVFEPVDMPAVAEGVSQMALVENVSIESDDKGVIRLAELRRYGFHRLALRIGDKRPKELTRWSIKVRPDGCSKVKFELHDDGARKYGMCVFDLKAAVTIDQGGALVVADAVALPEGFLQIDLALPWTEGSLSHFSINLLDRQDSLVHAGDNRRAIEIAEIAFR